jgi:ATP-binding cassette subfamily B (MDR/TAP) protein 1
MPVFGALMGKMLFIMMDTSDYEILRQDSDHYCLIMLILAISAFMTGLIQKFSFGIIGENVTLNIRKKLYKSIITKHMGWFDSRDNAPGVLTSTLSSDA